MVSARITSFFILLLAVYSRAEITLSRLDGDKKGKNFVYVGDELQLRCVINNKEYTASNITFSVFYPFEQNTDTRKCINQQHVDVINETTAVLSVRNISRAGRAEYSCYTSSEGCINNTRPYDALDISIQYHPQNVTNFTCVVFDFDVNMNCTWQHPVPYDENPQNTIVSLIYNTDQQCTTMEAELSEATEINDPLNCSRAEQKFIVYQDAPNEAVPALDTDFYMIVHQSFLNSLISAVACVQCGGNQLQWISKRSSGLASKLEIKCPECKSTWSGWSSPKINKKFDINYRTIIGCKDNGIGFTKLHSLFSVMNIKAQMHHKTFYKESKTVDIAAKEAAEEAMSQAARVVAERVKASCPLSDKAISETGYPIITVSYDGTWQKRGHSSHNGVGVSIDVDSGLVLDTQVISNFCKTCVIGPKPSAPEYANWIEKHKPKCQKNADCSSNAMEAVAAKMIFSRSIEKRKLIYGTMLCDGDSKAFNAVQDCYDIQVTKEDCINHIAKRMFNALENLKKANKASLNRKLTKPVIEKITNTYAKNLKDNAPDVKKMKNGVLGGFFHMMSTDKAPNHRLCPEGENSWCHYQRALKTGLHERHRPTFSSQVGSIIYPIIMRLTDSNLLQRCAKMETQNANESFNALIWQRCPKTVYSSMTAVETATSLAVLSFNCGPVGLKMIMSKIGLKWGHLDNAFSTKMLKVKCGNSKKRTLGISKWKRKNLKKRRIEQEHLHEVEEGETYVSGGFNS